MEQVNYHIAPCGMNCRLCMAYQRAKNKCSGCRGSEDDKTISRLNCKIKKCKDLNSEFCFSCTYFPCEKLKHIDKRYRSKYNMSMISNLEVIMKNGLQNFTQMEKEKWTCEKCGSLICVHKKRCIHCGTESIYNPE